MTTTEAVNYVEAIPDILKALGDVHAVMNGSSLDRTINHLVVLRASQINGCAQCVKMHTREAREDGERNERLDRLVVWDQVDDFSPRERAALAWTEALTRLDRKTDYGALREALRKHFSEEELGVLTITVGMINLWNRVRISAH